MHALDQVHVWVQQLYRDMTFAEQTGMGKKMEDQHTSKFGDAYRSCLYLQCLTCTACNHATSKWILTNIIILLFL